jgi:hypothetical protein
VTTRISVDLPADLLEAANLNQYKNRNRLASREDENRFKQNAKKQVKLIPLKDKKDLYKGASLEYKQSIVLPKSGSVDFGWLAIEETCKTFFANNTIDICQGLFSTKVDINYGYSFAVGSRVTDSDRYFNDSLVSYLRGVDFSIETTTGGEDPVVPLAESIKLKKNNFEGLGTSTSAALNNADGARFIDFTIYKQVKNFKSVVFTGNFDCDGIVLGASNRVDDIEHYIFNAYLSIPKSNKSTFLYVVWRTTGSENSEYNGLRILEEDGVDLSNYGRRLAVTWWSKDGDYRGGMPLIGATKKQSYQDYPVFSGELLPEGLRGFMTAIFEINPNAIDNVHQLIPKITFFAKPYAGFFGQFGSDTGVLSLNERFLVAVSRRNYAAS